MIRRSSGVVSLPLRPIACVPFDCLGSNATCEALGIPERMSLLTGYVQRRLSHGFKHT